MIVLTYDIGSTNIKLLILNIEKSGNDEKIELISKVRERTTDFANFFYDNLVKYNIKKSDIEKIIVTGTGASYLSDSIDGIDIIKVDEFTAIAYGGLILSKLDEAIIVSIGTGTTILYTNLDKIERLGGTGLGGGTFVGLSNALLQKKLLDNNVKTFNELIEIAKKGDRRHIDLTIGDISKYDIANMSKDLTAANFAKMNKPYVEADLVASVINLIIENISLLVNSLNKNYKVVYIGTFVTDENIRRRLKEFSEYTGDDIVFVDNSDFVIAIGAWEYYLLKIREPLINNTSS